MCLLWIVELIYSGLQYIHMVFICNDLLWVMVDFIRIRQANVTGIGATQSYNRSVPVR